MEWWLIIIVIFGSLVVLMTIGLPVAFCFILINIVGAFFFMGGSIGIEELIPSFFTSVSTFTLLPLPLFVLMGEVLFHSGAGPKMLDALDKWLGRLPGRLSLLAVGGGTLFSTLTGAPWGSIAMLGATLVPEMEKRGYKKPMTLGPIMGSGGLAIMIPPSGLAVLFGAIGEISVGRILMAIIIPGLILAILYASYIIIRCWLQPSIAPSYDVPPTPLLEKLVALLRYVLPVGIVIFLVIGVIFLGVATPTEAAATGAIGSYILAFVSRGLNWEVFKRSAIGTLKVTVMIFLIIMGAKAFSQLLAFTGTSRGLVDFAVGLPLLPILIIGIMQVVVIFLGMFMEVASIMMITIPLFIPIVLTLGYSPVWFAAVYLLNAEMAGMSPPFGLSLFVMKSVAPADTSMIDVYRAALPFLYIDILAIALVIAFPVLALWLPGIMR